MAKVDTIVVVGASDATIVAKINVGEDIPAAYVASTERTVTDPQSPAVTLAWLTMRQLVEIADESGVANPSGYATKASLVSAIMVAKSLVLYDSGTALRATSGQATLDGGSITVPTTAVTATCQVLITAVDTPAGRLFVSDKTAGTSFAISSTDINDVARVDWMIVEP